MSKETKLVEPIEYTGKFKVGDRVKVTDGSHKGYKGVVTQLGERVSMIPSHVVLLDEGREGRGCRWFAESLLELVEEGEQSAEQEAFEYLLSRDKDTTRRILQEEVATWAKVHLEHKDYNDLRQTTEILEKLEKGE